MKDFSCIRFTMLLFRVLEVGVIVSLALRWFDATAGFWWRITLSRRIYDGAMNFSLLALVLLLLISLLLLFTHKPRASTLAIRTLVYVVVFCVSPTRLGSSGPKAAQSRTTGCTDLPQARSLRPVDVNMYG